MKKINISKEQKEQLEKQFGVKIYVRNSFSENKAPINQIQEQAKTNASLYLERKKLGQKLNLFEENNLYLNLIELQKKLKLKKVPARIECYDISHLSGKFVYGSMVVFINGIPQKKFYRLFKTAQKNDDFANHREVLLRRFRRFLKWEQQHPNQAKDQKKYNPWTLPELIIVDGGKGQLSGDLQILDLVRPEIEGQGYSFEVEICALAKREERIFTPSDLQGVLLDNQAKFLVQRIRDEAHRFAIKNNRAARIRQIQKSEFLDSIQGVGPKTKRKLLATFGSVEKISEAVFNNPQLLYEAVGQKITKKLQDYYGV